MKVMKKNIAEKIIYIVRYKSPFVHEEYVANFFSTKYCYLFTSHSTQDNNCDHATSLTSKAYNRLCIIMGLPA